MAEEAPSKFAKCEDVEVNGRFLDINGFDGLAELLSLDVSYTMNKVDNFANTWQTQIEEKTPRLTLSELFYIFKGQSENKSTSGREIFSTKIKPDNIAAHESLVKFRAKLNKLWKDNGTKVSKLSLIYNDTKIDTSDGEQKIITLDTTYFVIACYLNTNNPDVPLSCSITDLRGVNGTISKDELKKLEPTYPTKDEFLSEFGGAVKLATTFILGRVKVYNGLATFRPTFGNACILETLSVPVGNTGQILKAAKITLTESGISFDEKEERNNKELTKKKAEEDSSEKTKK